MMNVIDAIRQRRAYRSLQPVDITEALVRDLAQAARLAPSCFNNQPWRYVFAFNPDVLRELHTALTKGNVWATKASLIIGVCSRRDLDCLIKERAYYLFDTGMATAFLILRAWELGLVAHPIAGFDEDKAKEILHIPADMKLITLVNVGKHAAGLSPLLSEKQIGWEQARPERLPLEAFAFMNHFGPPSG